MNGVKTNNKTITLFFTLVISIGMFFVSNILFYYGVGSYSTIFFNIFVLFTFIIIFVIWNKIFSESIVEPINLLIYVQFIFLGSNPLLKILGIESNDYFVGYNLTNNDYNLTNVLISLGVIFFLLGAIIGKIKKNNIAEVAKKVFFKNIYLQWSGFLILIVGVCSLIIDFDIRWLISTYQNFGSMTIWRLLWTICLPSSGFLLMSVKSKKIIMIGFLVLLFLSGVYILMGNRGYSISILLVLLWLYDKSIKKITKMKFLVISLIIVILVSIFFQMKTMTLIEKLNVLQYTKIMKESPIVSLLKESSVTYRTLIYTIKYIPNFKPYQLGASYFWALTTILPNIFGTPIHPAHYYYEGPSEWLRWNFSPAQAELGQGFGFSMIGEAFFNFGIVGVAVVMFLLGYFISRLSKLSKYNESGFYNVTLAVILSNIFWGIRNQLSSIVRDIVLQIIIIFIITIFVKLVFRSSPKKTKKEGSRLLIGNIQIHRYRLKK
jgi:oligosaccharide repeat unit polymerase